MKFSRVFGFSRLAKRIHGKVRRQPDIPAAPSRVSYGRGRNPVEKPYRKARYDLPDSIASGEWTVMFRIYGDESGKMNSNADRTSFCGYTADGPIGEAFSANWNACRFKWCMK